MKNWVLTKLGNVADFYNGGAWSPDEYVDSGIPVVRVSDISNETISLEECKYLSLASLDKYKKHTLFTGDLVITTVGSHPTQPGSVVGRPAIVPAYVQGALLNQNAVRITPSSVLLDKVYLGYLGKSQFFRDYIIQCARGSANQVRMSIGLLKEMEIPLPPLLIQQKIASILSAYDDLIENNTRRIKILEEMAQSFYHEWFVKFRFPGYEQIKMVESELGLIPEGWGFGKIKDVCEQINYGYTTSAKSENTGIKFLRITDIVPFIIDWSSVPFCEISDKDYKKYELQEGDIVIARTGATTGYAKRINKRHPKSIFASYLVRIRVNKYSNSHYIGLIVESDSYKEFIKANLSGAAQPQANAQILTSFPILLPPIALQEDFKKIVSNFLDKKELLQLKNLNLRQTRDLLLPKLISGEIDVEKLNIDTLDIAA